MKLCRTCNREIEGKMATFGNHGVAGNQVVTDEQDVEACEYCGGVDLVEIDYYSDEELFSFMTADMVIENIQTMKRIMGRISSFPPSLGEGFDEAIRYIRYLERKLKE